MTITATSPEHARQIFNELESKGFKHKLTYFWIQEWTNGNETILVGKGYYDKKPKREYLY